VLVGVVDLDLHRSDFYEKEISFQVSCSYGPGRYDDKYEQGGQDYPIGYVRWTEQRNFEAVLSAMQSGKLCVENLITQRFGLDDAVSAYDKIDNAPDSLGVVLQYPTDANVSAVVTFGSSSIAAANGAVVGVIGAGNFSRGVLLPALGKTSARIAYVADLNAASAHYAAKKFKAGQATTDYVKILDDRQVNAVFIVAGHHLHARLACEALEAGKHVFVEKPLCINRNQLEGIIKTHNSQPITNNCFLMVGFNRRFSPHTAKVKELLDGRHEPLSMIMTVNAGYVPSEHWPHDPDRGGGRIIGEGCHFIDLLSHIAGSPVTVVSAFALGSDAAARSDRMSINLKFADGSVGAVHYLANGSKKYPKEHLQIFSEGRILTIDNFRATKGYGFKGFNKYKTRRQDKGHQREIAAFVDLVAEGGEPLIPLDELVNVTASSFAAVESALKSKTIAVPQPKETTASECLIQDILTS
jgi:predicted dehydrogenase